MAVPQFSGGRLKAMASSELKIDWHRRRTKRSTLAGSKMQGGIPAGAAAAPPRKASARAPYRYEMAASAAHPCSQAVGTRVLLRAAWRRTDLIRRSMIHYCGSTGTFAQNASARRDTDSRLTRAPRSPPASNNVDGQRLIGAVSWTCGVALALARNSKLRLSLIREAARALVPVPVRMSGEGPRCRLSVLAVD